MTIRASDAWGNEASRTAAFAVDRREPVVAFREPVRGPSGASPFFVFDFESHDDDGASGGVTRESLWIEDCPILDGRTHGDGDGLLSDEPLRLPWREVCERLRPCRLLGETLVDATVRVQAEDCAGNIGVAMQPFPLSTLHLPADCRQHGRPSRADAVRRPRAIERGQILAPQRGRDE